MWLNLLPALQAPPLGLGGVPLSLDVRVTPSDEVQQLRQQVEDLRQNLADLQAKYNRTEYLYRCETLINLQLHDLCKDHGIKVPHRLYARPVETDATPRGDGRGA